MCVRSVRLCTRFEKKPLLMTDALEHDQIRTKHLRAARLRTRFAANRRIRHSKEREKDFAAICTQTQFITQSHQLRNNT